MNSTLQGLEEVALNWSEWWLPLMGRNTIFLILTLSLLAGLRRTNYTFRYYVLILAQLKMLLPLFVLPFPGKMLPAGYPDFDLLTTVVITAGEAGQGKLLSWSVLLFILWITAVLVLFAQLLYRQIYLWRSMSYWLDVTAQYRRFLPNSRIRIYTSQASHPPFVHGFIRPAVILPVESKEWAEMEMRTVLAHETGHILSGHIWQMLLQRIVQVIYFFHPLVWLLNRQMDLIREIRCDSRAIRFLGLGPKQYLQYLLSVVKRNVQPLSWLQTGLALAEKESDLSKRVKFQITKQEDSMFLTALMRNVIAMMFIGLILAFSCSFQGKEKMENNIQSGLIIDFMSLTKKPEILHLTTPKYPAAAKEKGIQTTVIVSVVINEQGTVERAEVFHSAKASDQQDQVIYQAMEESALSAAHELTFKPAELDGNKVKTRMNVPYQFKLSADETTPEKTE